MNRNLILACLLIKPCLLIFAGFYLVGFGVLPLSNPDFLLPYEQFFCVGFRLRILIL